MVRRRSRAPARNRELARWLETLMANEIVQHLMKQPGAKVEVTLEIHVEILEGATDDTVRTVNENCRTLKFTNFDFEESRAGGSGERFAAKRAQSQVGVSRTMMFGKTSRLLGRGLCRRFGGHPLPSPLL